MSRVTGALASAVFMALILAVACGGDDDNLPAVSGGIYTGTTSSGGSVTMTVDAAGTTVTEFDFIGAGDPEGPIGDIRPIVASPCDPTLLNYWGYELPITNGSVSLAGGLGIIGREDSPDAGVQPARFREIVAQATFDGAEVSGTIALVFSDNPDYGPECNSDVVSWTAQK